MTDIRRSLPRPSVPPAKPARQAAAPAVQPPTAKPDESHFDVTTERTSNTQGASASLSVDAALSRSRERTVGSREAFESPGIGRSRELASGSFDVEVDAFSRETHSADGRSGAELELFEVQASGTGSVSVGTHGLRLAGNVDAHVALVNAEAHGAIGGEHANAAGSVQANVTADVHASGQLDLGRNGLNAEANAGAFAGVRAQARGAVSVAGIGANGGVEVQAGIGVTANAQLQAGQGHLRARLQLGACLGVGLKVSVGVDINYAQLGRSAAAAGRAVTQAAVSATRAVVHTAAAATRVVASAAQGAVNAVHHAADTVRHAAANAVSNFRSAVGGLTHMFGW